MFGKLRNLKIESDYIGFAIGVSFGAQVTLPGIMMHS
jgi:hypothetical protein